MKASPEVKSVAIAATAVLSLSSCAVKDTVERATNHEDKNTHVLSAETTHSIDQTVRLGRYGLKGYMANVRIAQGDLSDKRKHIRIDSDGAMADWQYLPDRAIPLGKKIFTDYADGRMKTLKIVKTDNGVEVREEVNNMEDEGFGPWVYVVLDNPNADYFKDSLVSSSEMKSFFTDPNTVVESMGRQEMGDYFTVQRVDDALTVKAGTDGGHSRTARLAGTDSAAVASIESKILNANLSY